MSPLRRPPARWVRRAGPPCHPSPPSGRRSHPAQRVDQIWWLVESRCQIADFGQHCVAGITRALGVADIAVGEDRRQRDRSAAGDHGVPPAGRGELHGADRVDVVEVHPPAQQAADRLDLDVGGRHVLEVADHRDAPHVAVEPAGVRSQDILGDSACPPLEDLAVLVHQGVVGDVAPAQGAGVVGVDRPHDRRGVLGCVVVAARGVVHHGGVNRAAVHRAAAPHRLVGPTARAG